MTYNELKAFIAGGGLDAKLAALYEMKPGDAGVGVQRERYLGALEQFDLIYGKESGDARELSIFSVPGRSEIMGNHTDHQYGCVIAASITLDCIAVAAKRDDGVVRIKSEGFPEDVVLLASRGEPDESRFFHSDAIIAGVCAGFASRGYKTGGFDAYTTSNVLKGSGLSSSAAFEDMVGNIENHFYNGGIVSAADIALISQFAENKYFGKPCGLMDQMACAWGGLITIDFKDPAQPKVRPLDFDLTAAGYSLCITDTGGNHADLNADYASVPAEMKAAAAVLGEEVLRPLGYERLLAGCREIREKCGDRAFLRAVHFVRENERVRAAAERLCDGELQLKDKLDAFLSAVCESGDSSYKYLQNVYTTKNVCEQGLSLALCVSECFLSDKRAAWRVHGGGFAGTIQAFVPDTDAPEYKRLLDSVFGEGKCMELRVRQAGAVRVL